MPGGSGVTWPAGLECPGCGSVRGCGVGRARRVLRLGVAQAVGAPRRGRCRSCLVT